MYVCVCLKYILTYFLNFTDLFIPRRTRRYIHLEKILRPLRPITVSLNHFDSDGLGTLSNFGWSVHVHPSNAQQHRCFGSDEGMPRGNPAKREPGPARWSQIRFQHETKMILWDTIGGKRINQLPTEIKWYTTYILVSIGMVTNPNRDFKPIQKNPFLSGWPSPTYHIRVGGGAESLFCLISTRYCCGSQLFDPRPYGWAQQDGYRKAPPK